jgi:outer membrane protein assembly factor BamA
LKQKEPLFDKTIPGTKEVLARVARETEEFLAKSGHPENVAGKLMGEGTKELSIVFGPSNLPSVAEIKFTGNDTIKTPVLQQSIAGVAVGFIYSAPRFQQLLDTSIRPLYEAKGKIRVAFPKLETELAKDVNGLIVTVQVVEGPTFKLGEVNLTGVPGIATLVKEGKFKPGEDANFSEIEESTERIRAIERRAGYMLVKSQTERKIDDKEKKVDLVIHIERGPLFSFGKLTIQGLDIQSEPQIRKLWAVKPGAPFNAEYPTFFLARVKEDGYFDNLGNTKSKLDIDDKSKIVDVTLIFSGDGKAPPAIGPEKDAQERRERQQRKQQ